MRITNLALGMLAGLVLALAQEPYNYTFTVFLSALIVGIVSARNIFQKYWFGYGFGLGYFLLLMIWIEAPFAIRGPEFAPLAIPAYLLMSSGLALFYAPFFTFFEHKYTIHLRVLGTIGVVTFMEWLRGTIFTGLPWGLPAYTLIDHPSANALAFIGPYLLSGFVIGILALFSAIAFKDQPRFFVLSLVILSLPMLASLRPAPEFADVADYEIAIVQANFPQQERHLIETQTPMLDAQIELSKPYVDADLILWPETSVAYSPEDTEGMLDYLKNQLGEARLFIGAPKYLSLGQYNSAYLIESGEILHRYDKQHLVPFGEYVPYSTQLIRLGFPEAALTGFSIRKGEARALPEDLPLAPFKPLICYEGIFPNEVRGDEAFIVQLTNDSWFGPAAGPRQHLASIRARAIETGKPVARAATTGISAIISSTGQIIAEIPMNTRGSTAAKLGLRYENTLYNRFGDWITLLGAVFSVFIALLLTNRQKQAIEPAT